MNYIKPNWPAPSNVLAFSTTRKAGHSLIPFDSFNLGDHVGDNAQHVVANRRLLAEQLELPTEPVWLQQVHSNQVITLTGNESANPIADASIAKSPKLVCVIMTADCLPILLCDQNGKEVAAIHAGWRGLANNVIENTIAELHAKPSDLYAWLGPAIGPNKFEVSEDVFDHFVQKDGEAAIAFRPKEDLPGKWLANIYTLARQRLTALGVTAIFGGDFCTYEDEKKFFSYRRDRGLTGRMATLIWLS